MVEALTRALIFNSLRSTKFTVGRALAASSSREAMEHPLRAPPPSNFFTPFPRVCKGKERAREIQEFACSHCASHSFVHRKDVQREWRQNAWRPGLLLA